MRVRTLALICLAALAAACQKGTKDEDKTAERPVGKASGTGASVKPAADGGAAPADDARDIDSKDILARESPATMVDVKHVLVSWKELAKAFRGRQDPRGAARDNAAAAKLAEDVAAKLRAAPGDIDKLIQEHSEDPGSLTGKVYNVTADAGLVPEFKQLALRLQMNEAGIVKTAYGYHIMVRVEPPPADPVESADILARPPIKGSAMVQHILVGWKDVPAAASGRADPRGLKRTKAEADKLALDLLAKVRKGDDMKALMKEFSEDQGSAQTGEPYPVDPTAQLVEPFKNLSMRLQIGEAGVVKTDYGWHVIKRVEPPPPPPPPAPDALDSKKILDRAQVTEKAKVKHILLGWTEAHADDPRGTKRSRKDLEKLVKATMARLAKGEKIEALMSELSEDGGSAKSGEGYDVTPDASLVPEFKNLSLRLNVGEVGAVKTVYGIHIIQRVE